MADAFTGIAVNDVIEASKGTLQKQLYATFTTPTNGSGRSWKILKNIWNFR